MIHNVPTILQIRMMQRKQLKLLSTIYLKLLHCKYVQISMKWKRQIKIYWLENFLSLKFFKVVDAIDGHSMTTAKMMAKNILIVLFVAFFLE